MQGAPTSSTPPPTTVGAEVSLLREVGRSIRRRRQSPRVVVDFDISLGTEANFYAGVSENISQGGVFVVTHLLRRVGEGIVFRIHLPGSERSVHGVGVVRWVREYSERTATAPGMGVEFQKLGEGAHEALRDILLSRTQPGDVRGVGKLE